MTTRLNQIIAVEKGVKTKVYAKITQDFKLLQKDDLFNGLLRKYTPKDDDPTLPTGELLPDEIKTISHSVKDLYLCLLEGLKELMTVTATKDVANTMARADVVVDGEPLITDCPPTHLLFLEKVLKDVHAFAMAMPVLDPGEQWTISEVSGVYESQERKSIRTKKLSRPMVLYEATKEHPAQVKETTEDVLVGEWTSRKSSLAIPATERGYLIRRIEKLQKAVKYAREQANMTEVPSANLTNPIIDYLLKSL